MHRPARRSQSALWLGILLVFGLIAGIIGFVYFGAAQVEREGKMRDEGFRQLRCKRCGGKGLLLVPVVGGGDPLAQPCPDCKK